MKNMRDALIAAILTAVVFFAKVNCYDKKAEEPKKGIIINNG